MHAPDGVSDARFLFGYEEALGYAVTGIVRDKDGISAALAIAQLAAQCKRDGRSLADRLDGLARRFGLHATGHWSLELPDEDGHERIEKIMEALRASPPPTLGGRRVTAVDDLALPPSDVLVLHGGDELRVVIRPSGTEPKLKAYLQVIVPVDDQDVDAARGQAARELEDLGAELSTLVRS